MAEVEGIAWSRQVMGEAGPHVRALAPRVLATLDALRRLPALARFASAG